MPTGRTPHPPSLQRLPPRTPEGRRIQEALREPVRLDTDYSALELRILRQEADRRADT